MKRESILNLRMISNICPIPVIICMISALILVESRNSRTLALLHEIRSDRFLAQLFLVLLPLKRAVFIIIKSRLCCFHFPRETASFRS